MWCNEGGSVFLHGEDAADIKKQGIKRIKKLFHDNSSFQFKKEFCAEDDERIGEDAEFR